MRFATLILGLSLVACGGSVQVLQRAPQSGLIAISGSDDAAHGAADRYMKEHCAGGYTVFDETPTSSGWKMSYRCNDRATLVTDTSNEARVLFVRRF